MSARAALARLPLVRGAIESGRRPFGREHLLGATILVTGVVAMTSLLIARQRGQAVASLERGRYR